MKPLATQAARLAPNLTAAAALYRLLRRQRRAYAAAGRDPRAAEDLLVQRGDGRLVEVRDHDLTDARVSSGALVASQKHDELIGFLRLVQALEPRRLCEIGTSAGGTLYGLTRVATPDAVIVSVDLSIPETTRLARQSLARERQRIISIEGDSHDARTRSEVEEALGGRPLDVVFIDGDHSYDGVRSDFEIYTPLVRPGGIVGLHDVVEDFGTRHGLRTPSISGDVPRYWRELKAKHRTEELVADPAQDGFGIGVVFV